jgi:hypothetical protein
VLRPFGSLDPDVVDPDTFAAHANTLMTRLREPADAAGVSEILRDLEALPALRSKGRADGHRLLRPRGGRRMIYAAQLILGEPRAIQWALSRASDVLGFADDELGTQMRERMLAWVSDIARTGEVHEEEGEKLAEVAAVMAIALTDRSV